MSEKQKLVKLDESVHTKAKINAAKKKLSLKDYLKSLVDNDPSI